MTTSDEEYLEYLNTDWSSRRVYQFVCAVFKAAEVPGTPARIDMLKAMAFMRLYRIVRDEMPWAVPEDIRAETERRWGARADRQRACWH